MFFYWWDTIRTVSMSLYFRRLLAVRISMFLLEAVCKEYPGWEMGVVLIVGF
jgi:hypothetical protein